MGRLLLIALMLMAAPSPAWSGPETVVFLGDSLTAGGRFEHLFPYHDVINMGVPGERTVEILKRVPEVVRRQPALVFVMAGTNDFWTGMRPAGALGRYRKILVALSRGLPEARIVVQSIPPVNNDRRDLGIRNASLEDFNRRLRWLAEELGMPFLDLTPVLSDSKGQLAAAYTTDGVHLSADGYRAWQQAIVGMNLL